MEEIVRANTNKTEIEDRNGRKYICGYGAVWFDGTEGTEFHHPDGYYERIERHAFDVSLLSGDNKSSCFNHSWEFVLGDSDHGTASFWTDDVGLRYSVAYDSEDPDHVKVKRKMEKGLITGSSIRAKAHIKNIEYRRENGKDIKLFKEMILTEAGPVDKPAFANCTAVMRSDKATDTDQQYILWKATQDRLGKLEQITR